MQSYIIVAKQRHIQEELLNNLYKQFAIEKFDKVQPSFEKSIGIQDLRNLQAQFVLKPLQGFYRAIILNATLGITTEAQNALLKILEEPPLHTLIVLVVNDKEELLPTILSRCSILENGDGMKVENIDKSTTSSQKVLTVAIRGSIPEKLKLAQDLTKNKEEALLVLESAMRSAQEQLLLGFYAQEGREGKTFYIMFLKHAQETYTLLKTTNVTPRLCLEQLFLS